MKNPASLTRSLPTCQIGSIEFTVDIKLNELRQTDEPSNRISINELQDDHGRYWLFFDQETRNVYRGATEILPDHVILATLPSLIELDPVGLARKYGLKDDALTAPGKEKTVDTVHAVQALQQNERRNGQRRRI